MKPTSEGSFSSVTQMFTSKVRATFISDVYTGGAAGAESTSLDEDTVTRLMDVLSDTDVPWMKLAEKLGMKTLTQLYVDTEVPCQHLLQHYKVTLPAPPLGSHDVHQSDLSLCVQLAGGPVQVLIEALQDLGLSEGVRLLKNTERHQEKHNTGNTHAATHTPPHSHGRTRQFDVSLSNQKPQLTAASAASQWRMSRSRWPISEEQEVKG